MGRDAATGLVVLAASLALFWGTLGLERHPMVPVGPGFYPRIVLAITAAFALVLVIADIVSRRKRGAAAARTASRPPPATPAGAAPNYALVLVSFGIFAGYVVLLPWLGFRVATLLFLATMQVALERPSNARGWARVAAVAIIATVATYLAFESYLHVLLPRGRWTGF